MKDSQQGFCCIASLCFGRQESALNPSQAICKPLCIKRKLTLGLQDWLFGEETNERSKRIFISFSVEDSTYRDHLVRQARNKKSPFEFMDMSVKRPWKEFEWKKKCRAKIKRSDGVIVLLSKNTWHASGARWEMKCAREEKKPIIGMHIKKNDRGAIPPELKGVRIVLWSWLNLERFINSIKI